ncbi:hypothetical protein OIV83_006079 [Microbotryomycetes sp. JL201]|nr:hypothetical protein OIV83_006079 [Microbotryomycetes sp. JL201]
MFLSRRAALAHPTVACCAVGAAASSSTPTAAAFASSSSSTNVSNRSFSSTTVAAESKHRRKARLTRRAHAVKKAQQLDLLKQTAPDPILGFNVKQRIPGQQQHTPDQADEQTLWDKSLLKSVLLDRHQVWGQTTRVVANEKGSITKESVLDDVDEAEAAVTATTTTASSGTPYVPEHFNFGLSRQEADELVNVLPIVGAMQPLLGQNLSTQSVIEQRLEQSLEREHDKRDKLMRIVDLRNADSKGIHVENTRRIIRAFGRTPNDTASPEVQAALLTAKIHNLKDHLKSQPRDVSNQRPLRTMIHQRSKILKYLRSLDVGRYEECLAKIGVEPRAVEGEVIVSKKTMRALIKEA